MPKLPLRKHKGSSGLVTLTHFQNYEIDLSKLESWEVFRLLLQHEQNKNFRIDPIAVFSSWLNMSQQTIRNWGVGKGSPKPEDFFKLTIKTGCSLYIEWWIYKCHEHGIQSGALR